MQTIHTTVAGPSHYPKAKELFRSGNLKPGVSVQLIPNPNNRFDKNAVEVIFRGEQLGHISAKLAPKYQKLAFEEKISKAVISEVSINTSGFLKIILSITYNNSNSTNFYFDLRSIPDATGVYEIYITGKRYYIGSTRSFKTRCGSHLSQLRESIHTNKKMQIDFKMVGERNFNFKPLMTCSSLDQARSFEANEIIKRLKKGQDLYNETLDGQGRLKIKKNDKLQTVSDLYKENPSLINQIQNELMRDVSSSLDKQSDKDVISKNDMSVSGDYSGRSSQIFANGDEYDGDFVNGKRTGRGRITWSNGDEYEGDFIDGKRTGRGKITWADGNEYEGDFIDGKLTGEGKFTWSNGDEYEGDFVNGKRTGTGIYTWSNGDEYEGDFVNNKPIKKALDIKPDGSLHKLDSIESKQKDERKNFSSEESILSNEILVKNNYSEKSELNSAKGQKKFISPNGSIFADEIVTENKNSKESKSSNAKRRNTFIRKFPNGDRYIGEIINGERTGAGIYEYANGNRYEGNFLKGKFSGHGVITFSNGDVYEGEWLKNKRQGKGTLYFSNGKIYKGEFKENEQTGRGTLTVQDGSKYSGIFKNGKIIERD